MPLQDLNNFLGLQVPEIDVVVLAATNNPFARSSDTKSGKDAIGIILVADVSFQDT